MTLYAVISDIHANYPALEAVADDARETAQHEGDGDVRFVCLGDVVDYGPQPNECMAWVRENVSIIIQGNHDRDVAAPLHEPPQGIDPKYWPITLWTSMHLNSDHKDAIRTWKPKRVTPPGLEAFTLLHSSPSILAFLGYPKTQGPLSRSLFVGTHRGPASLGELAGPQSRRCGLLQASRLWFLSHAFSQANRTLSLRKTAAEATIICADPPKCMPGGPPSDRVSRAGSGLHRARRSCPL